VSAAFSLAWRTLARRPRRFLLFGAGVAVAGATLLDMVMLSAGLERSLRLLESTGYQVRVTPRGLLPFEADATIPDAGRLIEEMRADPRIEAVTPVWGQTVYVDRLPVHDGRSPEAAFGLGLPTGSKATLRIARGRTVSEPDEVVVDENLAARLGLAPGDSLTLGLEPEPVLGGMRSARAFRVVGIGRFVFSARGSESVALDLKTLAALADVPGTTPAALLMVRVAGRADPYAVVRDYRRRIQDADIYAIPEIIEAAGDRLTYFRQLSRVLGTVSIGVTFLLVSTLLILSVNERWGEIATLRAIGVTRPHILAQVTWQGLLISLAGAIGGVALGWPIARYLDAILRDFPGLPLQVSFFVLEPRDIALALGLIIATGLLAGLYPAWRAASVNITATLRGEAA
jgi:putative ABC transport system permease protein